MNGAGSGGGGTYHSEDDYDEGPLSSKIPIPYKDTFIQGNLIGVGLQNPGGLSSSIGSQDRVGGFNSLPGGAAAVPGVPGGPHRGHICCLIDDSRRCTRPAGNAGYSKRIQKTVVYKKLRLDQDHNAQHIYICDHHKMVIQNARTKVKKESEDEVLEGDDVPEVDLYQLQVNTLRRYKKHFKIPTRPGLNKAQLADILMRNFKTIPVTEKDVITYFIYTVKNARNKLDMDKQDRPPAVDTTYY